jgi:hypothetical protein
MSEQVIHINKKYSQSLNPTSTTMHKCMYMFLTWKQHAYLLEYAERMNICNVTSTIFFLIKSKSNSAI